MPFSYQKMKAQITIKHWTLKEIEILKQFYPNYGPREELLEKLPSRTRKAIMQKAFKLGLRVSPYIRNSKISISHLANKNPMWKGDAVSYTALHDWIGRHKPKPDLCEECKKQPPYELANISGEYRRDFNDFKWLCRSCHMKSDGRFTNLIQYRNGVGN